jgi:hypothetical protein
MAAYVTHGVGKLYDVYSEKLISIVNYKIHEELTTTGILERCWGELTLADSINVPDGNRYMIELEDGRKGNCSLRRRVNRAVISVPPRYFYLFQGVGVLK